MRLVLIHKGVGMQTNSTEYKGERLKSWKTQSNSALCICNFPIWEHLVLLCPFKACEILTNDGIHKKTTNSKAISVIDFLCRVKFIF